MKDLTASEIRGRIAELNEREALAWDLFRRDLADIAATRTLLVLKANGYDA